MIGRTLGHFRILEKLGAGGMGEVYRARDEHLERDVAIKVLPAGTLADDEARNRFRQEALALSKLNHPNIATVHDFATEAQLDFLVMEHVPGTTLNERLATGPLTEKEILLLGAELAEGLAAAHEQGVIHCDLKPGNLRVTPDGRLKILDFGLARFLSPAGESAPTQSVAEIRDAAGTLPYMSPEQVNGAPPDPRRDIYATGAVLYEMATGQRLFPNEREPQGQLAAILHRAPRPPRALNPHISAGLESVILKCLEKDPEHRYQSAREILADLRRIGASPSSLAGAARRGASHPRRAAIIGLSILGAVVLGGAVLLRGTNWWGKMLRRGGATPHVDSLAVLPFTNLSADPEQEYFGDGIADALITDLGQIGALRVISRTSVMQYKSSKKLLGEIAHELNVDAIVEGSVSRQGDRARVIARLVYAPTDAQLWSKTYDYDVRDLLALQNELAGAIVKEIKVALTAQEQARLSSTHTVVPAAHEAYLKGDFLNKGSSAQQRKAKEYFEQAVSLDPSYAPAYSGLAEYYWSTSEIPSRVALPKAEQYALKALELDPTLARAHTALGAVRFYGEWDWASAENELKRAIELNPNDAEARRTYAFYLSALGRVEEALAEIRRAQEVDPLYIRAQVTAGWVFYFARRFDDATEQCRRALELDPSSDRAYDCLGLSLLGKGSYEGAIAACQESVRLSGNDPLLAAGLGRAYARAGRRAEATKILGELLATSKQAYLPPYLPAILHAALGEREQAFSWLGKAFEEHQAYLVWLNVDPAVDPLRDDPRFAVLLHRVGLSH